MRSISRVVGVSINTVTKLLVRAGEACAAYHNETVRNVEARRIQCDEIWSFVYAKQKNVPKGMEDEAGTVWTWTAIDADTKLVPCWHVGSRNLEDATSFISDLASRLSNRVQLTTDGYRPYLEAINSAFGNDIDYARLVKIYGAAPEQQRRYSPSEFVEAKRVPVTGDPDENYISTSFVERQNLTMRMSMRRFTRLTNGFSKKLANHMHAISLHYMYYNFGRVHGSLKTTPAIKAGVTEHVWSLEEIATLADNCPITANSN